MTTKGTRASHPNAQQMAAIVSFAKKFGRNWKSKLSERWRHGDEYLFVGQDSGALLRQVRNEFGPNWLKKFSLNKYLKEKQDGRMAANA